MAAIPSLLLILLLMLGSVIHGCAGGGLLNPSLDSKLFGAIPLNSMASAKENLDKGANVNARDGWGQTPLMLAAANGHLTMVQLLVERGAEVNLKESFLDNTALHRAAEEQKPPKGQVGNMSRAEIDAYNKANRDRPEIVKYLLAHGAEVNAKNKHGKTPLHEAIQGDRKATVEVLLANGAALEPQGGVIADTPLMMAAKEGDLEMVQFLLDKGAKVNARGKIQGTALMEAAFAQHPDVVALLLARGADVNVRNQGGMTPLMLGVQFKPDVLAHKVAVLLLDAGADVNAVNNKGETAVMKATQNGNVKTVELLNQRRSKR